jgi:hypothetical protein
MSEREKLDHNNDVWLRISILENKLAESEKRFDRMDATIQEIHKKLDSLKDDLRGKKDTSQFESRVKEIEADLDSVKVELPEIRLVKKLFMGLVAFLLTAFLGLVWNSLVLNPTKTQSMHPPENLNDIAKKFVEEYNKGGPK